MTPERYAEIKATLKELEAAWLSQPDQRLGQLICNVSREWPSGRVSSSDVIWERRDKEWRTDLRATWS